MADKVQFARLPDGREVAYRVMSGATGPVILHTTAGPFPLDLLEEEPMYDRFLQTLGGSGRVVLFDKPGVGSSDPIDRDRDFHGQLAAAHVAVLNALDVERAWLVGSLLSALARTIQAHPTRVLGAVLINPISVDQQELVLDSTIKRDRSSKARHMTPSRADDLAFVAWTQRASRLGVSRDEWAAVLSADRLANKRFEAEAGPIQDAPPVLLIRRRDSMSRASVDFWTRIFPEADSVTIEGADSGVMALDAGLVAELAAGFISGEPVETSPHRRLVAVLFTDLVNSTPAAAASGDEVWRSTLDRYEATLQRTIQRHHGTVVKHTGDGALTTFPSGTEAITAAVELRITTRDLGLEGRTGVHLGEVEQRDDDISGIGVNLAARVMGEAGPGEILVSSSVEQTTVGGRFRFDDRGTRSVKGIDRPWQLFAVEPR